MSNSWFGAIATAVVVAIVAIIVVLTGMTFAKPDGGHIAVVRNGGPLDNNQIRGVVQPGSSRHWAGMFSHIHLYPANQRYYTISADEHRGDRPGVDVFTGSTSDGVNGVGIEGTVQFRLNTDVKTIEQFDNRFGTRTYPLPGSSKALHPWAGDDGWDAFLDSVFRPVLDNALRVELQSFRCVDLIPSCSYVRTGTSKLADGRVANANLAQFEGDVQSELQRDIDQTLGGRYLTVGVFRVSRPSLPRIVADKIDQANAAKVEIQRQQFLADQKVQQAEGDKRSNQIKAQGIKALNNAYKQSPAKAQIDAIASLPQGLQTLVLGDSKKGTVLSIGK